MKRIGYSILIGAGCAFVFFGISKLQQAQRKNKGGLMDVFKNRSFYNEIFYSVELRVAIGKPEDDNKLIERTRQQILYRLRDSYSDVSLEKLDKNVYTLKANKILDTAVFKNSITAPGKIEFSELFSLAELSPFIVSADSQLRSSDADHLTRQKKIEEARKTLDTTSGKLSAILDHTSALNPGLLRFISFTQPYQNANGAMANPAELGYIKTTDTAHLNQILNDPKISGLFPQNLEFTYGYNDIDLNSDDSILKIYAKKNLDRSFFPYPTGDQITEASPSFDPLGNPLILFKFNSQGAQDWYLMTKRNISKPIAIITNNSVLTAAVVEAPIEGGQSRITGDFSSEETGQLCKMIMSGELPLIPSITSASFKSHSSKKFGSTLIILILFVFSGAAAYGISFLIKPASKP